MYREREQRILRGHGHPDGLHGIWNSGEGPIRTRSWSCGQSRVGLGLFREEARREGQNSRLCNVSFDRG